MTPEQAENLIGHKFKYYTGSIWEVIAVLHNAVTGETEIQIKHISQGRERRINQATLASDFTPAKVRR